MNKSYKERIQLFFLFFQQGIRRKKDKLLRRA